MKDSQKLIIRFEHQEGVEEVSYERTDIRSDESFWHWFNHCWHGLGLTFVSKELDDDAPR